MTGQPVNTEERLAAPIFTERVKKRVNIYRYTTPNEKACGSVTVGCGNKLFDM